VIVLGLSGLAHAQEHLLRTHPDLSPLDQRICQRLDSAAALDARPDLRWTHLGVEGTGVAASA